MRCSRLPPGSGQIAQAVLEQSHVTDEINRNVLSIKTLADDSSVGSQHAVHGITQLVTQLSDLNRLVRQFQKGAPATRAATRCQPPAWCRFAKPDKYKQSPQKNHMGPYVVLMSADKLATSPFHPALISYRYWSESSPHGY